MGMCDREGVPQSSPQGRRSSPPGFRRGMGGARPSAPRASAPCVLECAVSSAPVSRMPPTSRSESQQQQRVSLRPVSPAAHDTNEKREEENLEFGRRGLGPQRKDKHPPPSAPSPIPGDAGASSSTGGEAPREVFGRAEHTFELVSFLLLRLLLRHLPSPMARFMASCMAPPSRTDDGAGPSSVLNNDPELEASLSPERGVSGSLGLPLFPCPPRMLFHEIGGLEVWRVGASYG